MTTHWKYSTSPALYEGQNSYDFIISSSWGSTVHTASLYTYVILLVKLAIIKNLTMKWIIHAWTYLVSSIDCCCLINHCLGFKGIVFHCPSSLSILSLIISVILFSVRICWAYSFSIWICSPLLLFSWIIWACSFSIRPSLPILHLIDILYHSVYQCALISPPFQGARCVGSMCS